MRPDVAKAVYEKITSLDEFDRDLQIKPDVRERDQLIDQVGDALADCTTHDRGRLFLAPTPWHAYFKLWERMAAARGRDSAAFFRGHNIVGLRKIGPSLYREDMTEETTRQARLAAEILAYMFKKHEILHWEGDDPQLMARTVAQHYGIRTSLLDVTLDPAVAIFFASTGGNSDAGDAFVFDWELCQVMGLKVILPPVSPWSRRLTIQRGFFLDFEQLRELEIEYVPFQVQFPTMRGFEVRRGGKPYVPWPIDEPAATELIDWVKAAAANNRCISGPLLADIETHGKSRVLLKHQFELMYGFSIDDPLLLLQLELEKKLGVSLNDSLPAQERHKRFKEASWRYYIDSVSQLEVYLNHLCLQKGYLAADRVLSLRETNAHVFDFYLKGLCHLRKEGRFLDPLCDQLLRILAVEHH